MASSPPGSPDGLTLCAAVAQIVPFARRWAVSRSPNGEDAIVFDAAIAVLSAFCDKGALQKAATPSARSDRFIRDGVERIAGPYQIPITVEDAAVAIHALARRFTNGRGTTVATLVNDTAHRLIGLGITMATTHETDGTIWAADGEDGQYDGLTEEQRAEALASLGRTPTPRDDG